MKAMDSELFNIYETHSNPTSKRQSRVSDLRHISGSDTHRLRGVAITHRPDDSSGKSIHGSRIEEICGQWYYQTREGTTEGPFPTCTAAQLSLDGYMAIARSKAFDKASLERINTLSLEPRR